MNYVWVVKYLSPVNGSVVKVICPTYSKAASKERGLVEDGLCVLSVVCEDEDIDYVLDI